MKGVNVLNQKHDPFNDGFLFYGHNKTRLSPTKKAIGKEFTQSGFLAFTEMSARDQDYSLVDALGSTLDLKLKTMYPIHLEKKLLNKFIVRISGIEYETIKIDRDRNKDTLFWYLQKVGEVIE